MKRNMYSSAVLAGMDLFGVKFCVDINHSWRQETRDTGLPDGKDGVPLRSLILTQYQSVTNRPTDRRTDGRTDLP